MANELEINFFQQTLKKTNKKVEKQPVKKLVIIAATIGVSFALTFGVMQNMNIRLTHYIQINEIKDKAQAEIDIKNAEISRQNKLVIDNNLYKKSMEEINKITPTDYTKFIEYLKIHQNIYDSRLRLLCDSLILAEKEFKDTYTSMRNIKNLVEINNVYKKNYETIISQKQKVYDAIKEGTSSTSLTETNDFLSYYKDYKLKLLIRDLKIENELNEFLYTSREGNKSYNLKNKIIEQYLNLEKEATNSINQ